MHDEVGDDMKTLTKREKVLLYLLLCIVILVGGVMLCVPALNAHTDLKIKNDSLNTQLASLKASIVEYKDLDKKIEEANKEYQAQVDKFYAEKDMKVEDVDNLITSMTLVHNLTPLSLQISDVTTEEIINYNDYLQQQAADAENKDSTEKQEVTAEEKGESAATLKVYNVSLTVKGTIANLQSMVNDANETKSLKVSSVTYSEQTEDSKEMSVTFKIYML